MTTQQKEFFYMNHRKLMGSMTKYYANKYQIDYDDLVGHSYDIFLNCLEKFDPNHSSHATFCTYLKSSLRQLTVYAKRIRKKQTECSVFHALQEKTSPVFSYQPENQLDGLMSFFETKLKGDELKLIKLIVSGKLPSFKINGHVSKIGAVQKHLNMSFTKARNLILSLKKWYQENNFEFNNYFFTN